MSDDIQAPTALPPRKAPPVPTEQEGERGSEPVMALRRKEIS
jgi:hypothetical protein